jgi:GT2 family glycosyltransferase
VAVLVSVVIPTFNRSRSLERTLAAIDRIEHPADVGFDVTVVDDGSVGEHARSVAESVAGRPYARLVSGPNRGPAVARNAGVRASSGPLVAFIDDDCAPATEWLVRLLAALERGGDRVGAVGGAVVAADSTNWVSRFCNAVDYATGVQPVFENASTQNSCFRRRVFEELEGFDESFRHPGGEDPDLSFRARAAGYELVYAPDAIVYHAGIESYRDFLRHMYRRGLGEARLGRKSGRERRVALRALLFPVYLVRVGALCWRTTAGKGRLGIRVLWLGLESLGRMGFIVGSVRGLVLDR